MRFWIDSVNLVFPLFPFFLFLFILFSFSCLVFSFLIYWSYKIIYVPRLRNWKIHHINYILSSFFIVAFLYIYSVAFTLLRLSSWWRLLILSVRTIRNSRQSYCQLWTKQKNAGNTGAIFPSNIFEIH